MHWMLAILLLCETLLLCTVNQFVQSSTIVPTGGGVQSDLQGPPSPILAMKLTGMPLNECTAL